MTASVTFCPSNRALIPLLSSHFLLRTRSPKFMCISKLSHDALSPSQGAHTPNQTVFREMGGTEDGEEGKRHETLSSLRRCDLGGGLGEGSSCSASKKLAVPMTILQSIYLQGLAYHDPVIGFLFLFHPKSACPLNHSVGDHLGWLYRLLKYQHWSHDSDFILTLIS